MLICKEKRINVINEKYFANFLQNSIIVHKQNKIQNLNPTHHKDQMQDLDSTKFETISFDDGQKSVSEKSLSLNSDELDIALFEPGSVLTTFHRQCEVRLLPDQEVPTYPVFPFPTFEPEVRLDSIVSPDKKLSKKKRKR